MHQILIGSYQPPHSYEIWRAHSIYTLDLLAKPEENVGWMLTRSPFKALRPPICLPRLIEKFLYKMRYVTSIGFYVFGEKIWQRGSWSLNALGYVSVSLTVEFFGATSIFAVTADIHALDLRGKGRVWGRSTLLTFKFNPEMLGSVEDDLSGACLFPASSRPALSFFPECVPPVVTRKKRRFPQKLL